MKLHKLVQDDDCHWYVIPSDHEQQFSDWLDSEEAEMDIVPGWAVAVGGSPSLVTFDDYQIE